MWCKKLGNKVLWIENKFLCVLKIKIYSFMDKFSNLKEVSCKMKRETKFKLLKTLVVFAVFVVVCLAVYLPLKFSGVLDNITSVEKLKEMILSAGVYGYLIFCLIQFLQTTFIPIPAMITTLAGVYVFGVWQTFLLSIVSILVGSIVNFALGRTFGSKIVYWVIGEASANKWKTKLEKGKYAFFLMMLFPFFPDDILCLVVGAITSMSFVFFIATNLITRPIALAVICFFGSGTIVPFSGWGIPVWIVLIVLAIASFFVSLKYEKQIEEFINNLATKLLKKEEKSTKTPANSDEK